MAQLLDQHPRASAFFQLRGLKTGGGNMFFPLFSSFSLSLFLRSPRVLENITIHPFFIVSLLFIGLFPPAWKAEDEDNRGASFFFTFSRSSQISFSPLFPFLIFCCLSPSYSHHVILFPLSFVPLSFSFAVSPPIFSSSSLYYFPL